MPHNQGTNRYTGAKTLEIDFAHTGSSCFLAHRYGAQSKVLEAKPVRSHPRFQYEEHIVDLDFGSHFDRGWMRELQRRPVALH
jgi:hypothetical protein